MTTPPSILISRLPEDGMIELRFANGKLDRSIPASDAIALAIRGAVEGVGPRSGRVHFLRWLKDEARPGFAQAETSTGALDGGNSTAFARTNMGAYRQPVRSAETVLDPWGNTTVKASGGIIGHVWAIALSREPGCDPARRSIPGA